MLRLRFVLRSYHKSAIPKSCSYPPTFVRYCSQTAGKIKPSQNIKSSFSAQNVNCEASDNKSLQNDVDDMLNRLNRHQAALIALTNELKTPTSTLGKFFKPNRLRTQNGPVISSEGYAVSSLLRAFVEACDVISEMPIALKSFRNVHSTVKRVRKNMSLDISLFHGLLQNVARLGQLQEFESLWNTMVNDHHIPDAVCYARFVQCLGASHNKNNVLSAPFVAETIGDMKNNQISLRDVSQIEGIFPLKRDLDNFLDGTKLIDGNFEFVSLFKPINYDPKCSLVSSLNRRSTERLSSPVEGVMSRSEMDVCFKEQLHREKVGYVDIMSIINQGSPEAEKYTNKLCDEWKVSLRRALELQVNRMTKRSKFTHNPRNIPVYPFFKVLDPEDYVDIMIQVASKVLVFSDSYSPTVPILQVDLGNEVMKKFRLKRKTSSEGFEEKLESIFKDYYDWFYNPSNSQGTWCHREAMRKILALHRDNGPNVYEGSAIDWPNGIRIAVGRELFHIVLNELRVNLSPDGELIVGGEVINLDGDVCHASPAPANRASCPALYKLYRLRKDQRNTEEVKPHPALVKLFGPQKLRKIRFLTAELPMLVPSVPWMNPNHGGFLLETAPFMRSPDDSGTSPLETNALESRLASAYPVFDSLNQLGSTPWKINGPVLDMVMHVFCHQTDECFTKDLLSNLSVPMSEKKLMQGEYFETLMQAGKGASDDPAGQRTKSAQKQAFYQMQKECFSLWCNTLYGLSIANMFRNDIVYFPHNIDFRGRVYPLPPHFNHMGNDLSRSLLVFAKGKPLGSEGLDWLKIHCVNLTGKKKKESLNARLQFANDNLEHIINSANHPFEQMESAWWIDSDEPWQTLAACMEIRNALASPCPEEFISHLPIHQDGSCNGLQHYAALGRDVLGGRSVNVLPSSKPQDVYSEIANIVNQKRIADEKNGHPIATVLNGFVDRKVIKQTVMTTVYGVTQYGAKLQIARQLKDNKNFPIENVDKAAKYLATKTFESLNEMFTASQQIQAWFTDCAHVISGTFLRNVEWETPIGLQVIQPYTKRVVTCRTLLGKPELSSVPVLHPDSTNSGIRLKPNSLKQRNGFPPNFVHSLDSTHMMLTSIYLWEAGITFASVHDCYWTHACSVTQMNVVCREQFVGLHSQPILENLSKTFHEKYISDHNEDTLVGKKPINQADLAKAKILFSAIPKKGALDLELVKDSIYFFS